MSASEYESHLQILLRSGPLVWIGIFTALMFIGAFVLEALRKLVLALALRKFWKRWREHKDQP